MSSSTCVWGSESARVKILAAQARAQFTHRAETCKSTGEWKLWLRCVTSITETQSVCETEKRKFKFFLFLFISLWTCITLCYVEMEHHAYEQSYMCVYFYVASTSASVYLCLSSGLQDIVSDTTSLNYRLIHLVYMVITHTRTHTHLSLSLVHRRDTWPEHVSWESSFLVVIQHWEK